VPRAGIVSVWPPPLRTCTARISVFVAAIMLHIGVGRYRSSGGHLCSEINPSSMCSNHPLLASGLRLLAKSNARTRGETPAPGEGTLDASLIQGGLYGNRISLASPHRQTNRPASVCHELLTECTSASFSVPDRPILRYAKLGTVV
jgi:hypothetical protein